MSVVQLTLPMFIGTVLNWALFGTLIVQTWIYFLAFPQDPRLSKLLVMTVFVLELVETLSNTRDMVHIFGAGWGNPEALDDVGWAWFSTPVMGSIIASVGQLFYARRLHILGRNTYVPGLIILVSIIQLGAGIWTGVNICIAKKYSLLQSHNLVPTVTWLAATSLCDLLIVSSTVFYLVKARTSEFQKTTNQIITRIVMLTAETGLLCAIFAVFDLYLFATFKETNFHLALCMELSKIYSNSILLILNWRAHIGHRRAPTDLSHHIHISDIRFNTTTGPNSSVQVELSHDTDKRDSEENYQKGPLAV